MTDDKRLELQERIEDGEERQRARQQHLGAAEELQIEDDEAEVESSELAQRARDAGSDFAQFAKDHPVALIAGGLVLGVAISALFPNSPTRKVGRKAGAALSEAGQHAGEALGEVREKTSERASALTAFATQLVLSFGQHLLESLETARDTGKEKLGEAGEFAVHARNAAVKTAKQAGKSLADRVRHTD
jgi:hypothetical protein